MIKQQTTYKRSPYNKDDYKSYVLATARQEALGGFLLGSGLGFIVWLISYALAAIYTPEYLYALPAWYLLTIPPGVVFAGNALLRGTRRESWQWNEYNQREVEITPIEETIALPELPPTAVIDDPLIERPLWIHSSDGLRIAANVTLTKVEMVRFQSFLIACSMGSELQISREHVTKAWRVKRTTWESWRDVMEEEGLAVFDRHRSPYLVNVLGKDACLLMASQMDKGK